MVKVTEQTEPSWQLARDSAAGHSYPRESGHNMHSSPRMNTVRSITVLNTNPASINNFLADSTPWTAAHSSRVEKMYYSVSRYPKILLLLGAFSSPTNHQAQYYYCMLCVSLHKISPIIFAQKSCYTLGISISAINPTKCPSWSGDVVLHVFLSVQFQMSRHCDLNQTIT